jgi:hypothetical protein
MGKWFIIIISLLTGCVSSKESDLVSIDIWRVDKLEVYNAQTNALVQTLYEDNLTLNFIRYVSEMSLYIDLEGHTIWRLEGDRDDILFTNYVEYENAHYNLSKYEYFFIESNNDGIVSLVISGGSLIHGIEGIIDENEEVVIYAYISLIEFNTF